MKKLITVCLLPVCLLSVVPTIFADDVAPPSWRGQLDTVTAAWDTWNQTQPMLPDSWTSNPALEMPPYASSSGASLLDNWESRSSVMKLTSDGQLSFWLPNFVNNNPEKMLRIQVTYWTENFVQYSNLKINGVDVGLLKNQRSTYNHGGYWWTDIWDITIYPNPASELILLNFVDLNNGGIPLYPAYVDQVVIDTWCVPEPVTVCLLSLGGLSLLRRKK